MTWFTVVSALRRVPGQIWAGIGVFAVCWFVYGLHTRAVSNAYAQGKRDAAQGVTFDSAMVARAAEVVALRTAHTDTVTRTVVRTRWQVDTLIRELPPEVAALPPVDTLVRVTQSLLVQVDSLGMAHTAERAAWTEKAKVDSAAIYALRILGTARADTIATLRKRPTKAKAFGYALGSAALGFFVGVVR